MSKEGLLFSIISITVIAGSIIYVFSTGSFLSLTSDGGDLWEVVTIEAVIADPDQDCVRVYCKNTDSSIITVVEAFLRDGSGNVLAVISELNVSLPTGVMTEVVCVFTYDLQAGYQYSVKLVSRVGHHFVSPAFEA